MSKPASQIKIGDKLCESDGFMWQVTGVRFTAKMVHVYLSPVFKTTLGEKDCSAMYRKSSMVRVSE